MTWAVARIAGVRRAAQKPSAALNLLGLSAVAAVWADVAENLLALALLCWFPAWPALGWAEPLLGAAMTLAALTTCAGLLGCAALFL